MKRKFTSYFVSQCSKPSNERRESGVEREMRDDSDETELDIEGERSTVALHGSEHTDDQPANSDSDSDSGVDPPECALQSGCQDKRLHTDQGHSSAVGLSVKCPDQSGPPDIPRSRAEGPVQPQLAVFPRTAMGDSQRNFQASWYSHHTWIEYSKCKDAVYCYACRNFGLPNT